jgi:hypothetical protein
MIQAIQTADLDQLLRHLELAGLPHPSQAEASETAAADASADDKALSENLVTATLVSAAVTK